MKLLVANEAFAISESSVYRVLKGHGLVREVKLEGFPASKKYRIKTTRVNEQWQSDASYFFVVGWGWLVLPDLGAGRLLADDPGVGAEDGHDVASISEVGRRGVEFTGMRNVP